MKKCKLIFIVLGIIILTGCNKTNSINEPNKNKNKEQSVDKAALVKSVDENIKGNYIYVKKIENETSKEKNRNITLKFEENKCVTVSYEVTYKDKEIAKNEYEDMINNDVNYKDVTISDDTVKYILLTDGRIGLSFYDCYTSLITKYVSADISYE